MTLVSDSSVNFFPNNKISNFVTQLSSPIDLTLGEWEVSLVDLIYPHSWYNVRKGSNLFGFDLGSGELTGRHIPPGCYETIPDILKAMSLPAHKTKIEFNYHPVTKKVKIKTVGEAKVVLHSGISDILGFDPGEYKGNVEGTRIADPASSFPVIYIYCDLLEPQIVGDVLAPLLKIIKVKGKDGETVSANFLRPHYVPVIRHYFQTVEMSLRLQSGDLVPFERGRVIAVLHFRRRQII